VRFRVTATPPIKYPNGDLKSSVAVTTEVPKAIGSKRSRSPAIGESKGTGWDRYNPRVMNSLATESDARALQQCVEMTELESGRSRMTDYNATTLEASGLHVHLGDENLNPRDNAQLRQPNDGTKKEPLIKCKPEVEIQMLTPREVHRRTGFCDPKKLLSYVAIM
jgi:hypothetical protein